MLAYCGRVSLREIYLPRTSGGAEPRVTRIKSRKRRICSFLDADDYWVNRDLLKELYNCFKNQNVDLVMFQMDKYTEKGRLLKRYRKKHFLIRNYVTVFMRFIQCW